MNEIKKAIEDFKILKRVTRNLTIGYIDLAIDALEKQVVKKPIIKSWSPALCPCCGKELSELEGDGYYKHWDNLKVCDCGQKLDWEVED